MSVEPIARRYAEVLMTPQYRVTPPLNVHGVGEMHIVSESSYWMLKPVENRTVK